MLDAPDPPNEWLLIIFARRAMNRDEYLAALALCLKLETVGAIAGEVAMLLRANSAEKAKLDAFRRIEACNKILCTRAFQREAQSDPRSKLTTIVMGSNLV